MNILITNTQEFNPSIGGVERVSVDLANELIKEGFGVYFLAAFKSKFEVDYQLPSDQLILDTKRFTDQQSIERFKEYLKDKKIDIVLNQAGNILGFTKLCVKACDSKIPLISEVHIAPEYMLQILKDNTSSKINKKFSLLHTFRYPLYWVQLFRLRRLYAYVYKHSNKVVLLSKRYNEEYVHCSKIKDTSKLIEMKNFTNFEGSQTQDKENIILFVGRLEFFQKRADRIVEVWEDLYEKFPGWQLRIAGDGPEYDTLSQYIQKNDIKNIKLLGFCDVKQEYKKAKILAMTSSFEGLPLVLVEGAMYGCVPIAFDSFASVYDIIEDKVDGFVIESYKLSEYAEVLSVLMSDPNYLETIAKQSKQINLKFDKDVIIQKWITLFKELKGE
ncbi:MAG: glycosyltransferase [Erysipelotrichaceae bacterium]